MTPEEYAAANHVRRSNGVCSCTGAEPCVNAAKEINGAWYCRASLCLSGRRLQLGNTPERVICDLYAPFARGDRE